MIEPQVVQGGASSWFWMAANCDVFGAVLLGITTPVVLTAGLAAAHLALSTALLYHALPTVVRGDRSTSSVATA